MFSPSDSDYWSSFRNGLFQRLTDIELTSRSSNKFEALVGWLANQWGLETGSVACKYVQHPKNRWNRLREALRRNPAAILLLFEGEDDRAIEERVSQGAVLSPSLALVVVLVRPPNGEWRFCRALYRHSASLPRVLRSCAGIRTAQFSVPRRTTPRGAPRPTVDRAIDLKEALRELALTAYEPKSKQRSDIADSIAAFTGLQPDSIRFKTIPSTKNLGNRLGEALGLAPSILVVVCPEILEERVVEEIDRWPAAARVPLIIVLQGERIGVRLHGQHDTLARLLGSAAHTRSIKDSTAAVEPGALVHKAARDPVVPPVIRGVWSYVDWNERLVNYTLGDHDGISGPVERIAATPAELAVVAGVNPDDANAVARAFADACKATLSSGVSSVGSVRIDPGVSWLPVAIGRRRQPRSPPFFAMLWFTCLVAYGYPDAEGGLHSRLSQLLGSTSFPHCLPSVWAEASAWTRVRRAAAIRLGS